MRLFDYLISIVVGLLTGVISSLIATKINNEKAEKRLFEKEKQIFERYLENIRIALEKYKTIKCKYEIYNLINERPYLETFLSLSNDEKEIMQEIADILSEIKLFLNSKKVITNDEINSWRKDLLMKRIKVLKFNKKV